MNRAKNFLIAIYYRPPDGSKHLHSEFNTILNDTLELINTEEKEAMIFWDFNVNFLAKNNRTDFKAIDLTDYLFLPNSLVSMLMYFSMSSTDEGCIPIFSYTKLFLVDLRRNNKVIFSRTAQET